MCSTISMLQDCKTIVIATVVAALTTHLWLKTCDPVPFWAAAIALLTIPSIATFIVNAVIPSSMFSLTLAYPAFYLALTTSICAYRLSPFHPLAKFPGPIIMRLTKLWGAWVAYQGQAHIYIKQLHDRYGPIIRIGPNELSTVEKELIPQILGNQGMPKGPLWDGRRFGNAGNSKGYDTLIDLRDSVLHAELRGPWNKAFGAEPMKTYEELLIRRIVELNDRLKKACSRGTAQVDMAKWPSCFTFDLMGDLAFSGDFRLMENVDKDGRLEMMDKAMFFMSITQHLPWIAMSVRSLPIINNWVMKFMNYGIEISIKRSQMEFKQKDLFYYMGEACGRLGSEFALIVQNCLLAIIAGSDTTASILSSIVYLLLSHPDKYKKLQQEVDRFFTEYQIDLDAQQAASDVVAGKMYGEVLGRLNYLNGVISEALRLFPAVPTSLQRAPAKGTSSKALQLGNTIVILPEGNAISVPPYAVQRDPRYFSPYSEEFVRERWFSSSSSGIKYVTSRDAFIPFSAGPQNCPGHSFALIEMHYALAVLVKNFNMEFDTPDYNPVCQWPKFVVTAKPSAKYQSSPDPSLSCESRSACARQCSITLLPGG
ncbi:cytochrome P450 [Gymnopilus junonius]|uniref:Cytochrome P450 n=1 Tax=Gymnopilus junonius TaxID=109634 RepID=A0A9P5TMZ3_GYMJU|nr:cytochrome P450 [Gymnopilus junonius]